MALTRTDATSFQGDHELRLVLLLSESTDDGHPMTTFFQISKISFGSESWKYPEFSTLLRAPCKQKWWILVQSKLVGDKERFDKEPILVTNCQFTP